MDADTRRHSDAEMDRQDDYLLELALLDAISGKSIKRLMGREDVTHARTIMRPDWRTSSIGGPVTIYSPTVGERGELRYTSRTVRPNLEPYKVRDGLSVLEGQPQEALERFVLPVEEPAGLLGPMAWLASE